MSSLPSDTFPSPVKTKFVGRSHLQGKILVFFYFCSCITEVRDGKNLVTTIYIAQSLLKLVVSIRKYGFQRTCSEMWKGKRTPCSTGSSMQFLSLVFQRAFSAESAVTKRFHDANVIASGTTKWKYILRLYFKNIFKKILLKMSPLDS